MDQTELNDQRVKPTKPRPGVQKFTLSAKTKAKSLSVLFLAIISLSFGYLGGRFATKNVVENPTSIQSQKVVLSSEGQVISGIAKTVGQSVVSVNATSQSASPLGLLGGGTQQMVAGTGIILTKDGLIITNRHVVPIGTTSVSITLSDGTVFNNVTIVGRTSANNSLDIAFLKIPDIKGHTLTPATIGDSGQMQIGQPVVAIGNALGQFQNTVTSGIISGHGRSIQASDSSGSQAENLADLFQTDAAINEGNSGGPLVNLSGQVIGINTALAGGAQNIGFAIPINDVSGVISNVEKTGKFEQPYLGLIYIPITSDIAAQYSLSAIAGAYIPPASIIGQTSVIPGGPADNAGIKEGDIISKLNGTSIDANTSLTALLDKQTVGDTVKLTVLRGNQQLTISVTLGAAPTG